MAIRQKLSTFSLFYSIWSTSSSILSTTGKHFVGQHLHKQLHLLSTPCTNPIQMGSITMIRTQEIQTSTVSCLRVTSAPKVDNFRCEFSYPTKNVTMAPIKEMPKLIQVCLYETLTLLLSHDMKQFEVDSLFFTAGPNVQVPKHGVSTSAG